MDGVINILKPPGMTSHDVVQYVRRLLKIKRVGHAGTLDPQAAGVLPLCFGRATRIVEFLMETKKEYRAELILGISTSTQDATGDVLFKAEKVDVTEDRLREILPNFLGRQNQIPPMTSAARYRGKRLYQLARKELYVERNPKRITIYRLDLIRWIEGEYPRAILDIQCSKGTYVRTLCADIGEALGCGAHMGACVRTKVGDFTIQDAYILEELKSLSETNDIYKAIMPMEQALSYIPQVTVKAKAVRKILNGQPIYQEEVLQFRSGLRAPAESALHKAEEFCPYILLFSLRGQLLAIGRVKKYFQQTVYQPMKVFT